MTDLTDDTTLDLPTPRLRQPSFCQADPSALRQWLEQLPRDHLGDSATRLNAAITELNHCDLEAKLRFALLEIIRPAVHSICESLSLHLRNQPVVLPPPAHQIFQLTQQIQLALARGYEQVSVQPAAPQRFRRSQKRRRELAAISMHRALNEHVRALFRCQLMYTDCDPQIWRTIHQLYQHALRQDLRHRAFEDSVAGQTCLISIQQCYIEALLLGTVHTSQLSQADLLQVFEYMPEWVKLAELAPFEASPEEERLVVDLDSGNPPMFSNCIEPPSDPALWRLLVVDKLLYHLTEQLADVSDHTLSGDLIKHLLISWGNNITRTFLRMDSHDTLSICVGLTNIHFFSAGEVDYQVFLDGSAPKLLQDQSDDNPFLEHRPIHKAPGAADIWDQPTASEQFAASLSVDAIEHHIRQFQRARHGRPNSAEQQTTHRQYAVRAINISPGGYGLAWPEQALARISNGDILGIRNSHQGNWSIGLVSWLRRSEGQATQLGVKLLGASVQPFGAREINQRNEEEDQAAQFQRVLFLPAIKTINQPATLITPARLFRERCNLVLVQQGRSMHLRLVRQLMSSAAISHFEVDIVSKPWTSVQQSFDELGDNLTADWPTL